MATYPAYAVPMDGSTVEWTDDLTADRAANGTMKVRAFYSAPKAVFTLQHDLSVAEVGTLTTSSTYLKFYSDNRLGTVDLTWAGVSYTGCKFIGAPSIRYRGARADVTVRLAAP